MTTINDIQDLVQIMEDRPEWRRELQRVLLTPDLRDTASLMRETAKLVAKNAESIAANAESIAKIEATNAETAKLVAKNAEGIANIEATNAETAKLVAKNAEGIANIEATNAETAKLVAKNAEGIANIEATNAETAKLVAKNTESIDKLDTSTKRLTEMAGLHSGHIGDMRGLFISQKVVREAALIADDMGLTFVGTLEPEDILNIWNAGKGKGLTNNISKEDERSFKIADLIIEAKADDGAQCFIAVEISFTVDERDTRRAIRNAEYITNFIEAPAYAAVAGVSKDNRIDGVLADMPEPHESEQETRVFWSQHEEIEKPN